MTLSHSPAPPVSTLPEVPDDQLSAAHLFASQLSRSQTSTGMVEALFGRTVIARYSGMDVGPAAGTIVNRTLLAVESDEPLDFRFRTLELAAASALADDEPLAAVYAAVVPSRLPEALAAAVRDDNRLPLGRVLAPLAPRRQPIDEVILTVDWNGEWVPVLRTTACLVLRTGEPVAQLVEMWRLSVLANALSRQRMSNDTRNHAAAWTLLSQLTVTLGEIDDQLLTLIERRMGVVEDVRRARTTAGLPRTDTAGDAVRAVRWSVLGELGRQLHAALDAAQLSIRCR